MRLEFPFSIQISEDCSISELQLLLKANFETGRVGGFLAVVDESKRVIGTISDSDIRRHMPEIADASVRRASDIMNRNFIYIESGVSVADIPAVISKQFGTRRIENKIPVNFIPVLDKDKKLVTLFHISSLIPILEHAGRQILIFGQGFVGITLALAMVDFGISVVAIERDENVREEIESLNPSVYEPQLREILEKNINNKYRLFAGPLAELDRPSIFSKRIHIIAVGTPISQLRDQVTIDLESINNVIEEIAPNLGFGDLIILRSTVPPGTTRKFADLIQERYSLQAGFDYHLAYAPERSVEGNAIAEVSKLPQLVSGYTEECTRQATNLFSEFVNSVVICENLEAAELGKLMTNAFRDVRFAFANEIAKIANLLNIDVIKMISDANLGYERNSIPMPSPGVGGPCLTKDSYMLGLKPNVDSVILSARTVNLGMIEFTVNQICALGSLYPGKILVIGVAFKGMPATNDLRQSTPIEICLNLLKLGLDLKVTDGIASDEDIVEYGIPTWSENECDFSIVCILNNNPKNSLIFQNFLRDRIKYGHTKRLALFDPWGIVARADFVNFDVVRYSLSSKIIEI